mmetsp:Transcript_7545/g.17391  ORF Transcript_7545/g.17391 Transcript_7545/m.17391 type:complete len:121 (+) Transcript_7545:83-445(+)
MPENKRAGIFYGSSDGHPIVWNNDWHSLIQKEVKARDVFTRAFLGGTIKVSKPAFTAIGDDGNAAHWASSYSDLGQWGPKTFRQTIPHHVSKIDAELPSVPPTAAGSDIMSEMAYRHARH